jgi:hypothetical protein
MESAQQVVAFTDQAHTASARAHITDGKDRVEPSHSPFDLWRMTD